MILCIELPRVILTYHINSIENKNALLGSEFRMEVNGLPVLSITGGCHWLVSFKIFKTVSIDLAEISFKLLHFQLPVELSVIKSINMSPERCKLIETFRKKVKVSVWLQKLGHPYGYPHNIFSVLHEKNKQNLQ